MVWLVLIYLNRFLKHKIYAYFFVSIFNSCFPHVFFLNLFSVQRLPFTLGFIGSMVGTIYVSMVLHSYVLSALFSVLQVHSHSVVLNSLVASYIFNLNLLLITCADVTCVILLYLANKQV